MMLRRIKLTASLGLIICLFIPLSKCSRTATDIDKTQEPVVYERYVVLHKEAELKDYIPGLFFIFPSIMVLLSFKVEQRKIFSHVIESLVSLLPLFVVFYHIKTGSLLMGGYLALFLSLGYLFACSIELWEAIKLSRQSNVNSKVSTTE